MTTRDAKEVLTAWENSSQYWNKHQAAIESMFAPLTRALTAVVNIQPGESVLDVAAEAVNRR
ncbi:MAG: hypothetical protein AABN95_07815 [Acidobacteriota bacterium]